MATEKRSRRLSTTSLYLIESRAAERKLVAERNKKKQSAMKSPGANRIARAGPLVVKNDAQ
jgi:hypothetical protein